MKKFTIEKKVKKDNPKTLTFRIEPRLLEPFIKMAREKNSSQTFIINKMIEYCLIEDGYLKSEEK